MSGSLRPINLGVPDITVVVRENSDANKVLVDVPNISVNIEKLPDYKVSVQPSSVVVQRTGSLPLLAVSALNAYTASYALSVSGSIDTAVSSSYALTASYAQNAGAGSGFPFSGSAVITGSLLVVDSGNVGGITGSLLGTASVADAIDIIFAGEFQTGSDAPIVLQVGGTGNVVSASYALTASYTANAGASVSASYASTASYISALSGGARGYIPLWSSNTTISSSGLLYQTASSLILGDGTTFFDETNPDKLGIYAGRTNSFNLVSAHANNNNYLQINIRNFSTGSNSSADIVATYDTGTEDTGYIDMGINGTSYVGANIHDLPGDGYIFTTGSNLVVGTATPNSTLTLFAGGESYSDGKLRLKASGQHQLTGSLNINSGSLIGTSSWAISASTVSTVRDGTRGYLSLWASDTTLSSSGLLYQTASSLILGDGTTFFDETNPDKLGIYAGRTNSFNLISAHANNNNYLQINIRNFSTGSNSSADIVATYDTGTEDTGYINMGINGTSYVGSAIHDIPGDGYIFTTGSNLVVGTATPNSTLSLFAGGENYSDGKLRLKANNQHQLTGSLNISGSQNILGNTTITGSVTVSGSLQANIFTLPTSEPLSPQTGSVYFSGSFIYVYTGTQYRSASLL